MLPSQRQTDRRITKCANVADDHFTCCQEQRVALDRYQRHRFQNFLHIIASPGLSKKTRWLPQFEAPAANETGGGEEKTTSRDNHQHLVAIFGTFVSLISK